VCIDSRVTNIILIFTIEMHFLFLKHAFSCVFLLLILIEKNVAQINLRQIFSFACEITGISLENSLTNEEFDLVHESLLFCKVIVIRDQSNLSTEKQREFSKRFGKLHVHLESSSHYQGFNDVNCVSNIKNADGSYMGLYGRHVEEFHSDLSWSALPTKITIVKSEIRPDGCGDTEFLDSSAAFDLLSDNQKELYHGLQASYCYLKHRDSLSLDSSNIGSTSLLSLKKDEVSAAKECAVHPVIITHPITGLKNIFANPSHTVAISNLEGKNTTQTSNEILSELFQFMQGKPQLLYRHVWKDGDLIMWDNRAVQHRATGCPDEFPRLLVRTTIINDSPPAEDLNIPSMFSSGGLNLHADRVNAELV